jgi:hypothetical protein
MNVFTLRYQKSINKKSDQLETHQPNRDQSSSNQSQDEDSDQEVSFITTEKSEDIETIEKSAEENIEIVEGSEDVEINNSEKSLYLI